MFSPAPPSAENGEPCVSDSPADSLVRYVEIINARGLHARASAKFCEIAGRFDAMVTVSKDGLEVGGTSIMGLLLLVAGIGSTITIRASGPEAEAAMDALVALVTDGFGEMEEEDAS